MTTTPPRATIREIPPSAPSAQQGPTSTHSPRSAPRPTQTRPTAPRQATAPGVPPVGVPSGSVLRQERASFAFAFQGLRYAWTTQRHLRIHVSLALLACGLGLFFTISPLEWAALVAVIALVTALELLNTVVEVVVDMITTDYHPSAKIAKDIAAGAVLVAAAGALLTGALIFLPRIVTLFMAGVRQ